MNDRYSRQQLFTPIGVEGQQHLQQKHLLIVGAGALGSATAEPLVRAGVGRVTIIDRDYVEWSNLQRQQLYTEQHAREKTPKAIAAKERLQAINADVAVEAIVGDANVETLTELLSDVDLVIDGTDNFDIRFIINDLTQSIIFHGFMALVLVVMARLIRFYRAQHLVCIVYYRRCQIQE